MYSNSMSASLYTTFIVDGKKKITIRHLTPKVRKTWGAMNPATRLVLDKTTYSRKEKHKNTLTAD